ncbi:MAG: carboxylesterase family protein [Bacteroidales bacterium]|nr:carboxylesterase family protein [Bacteroidales bacterium]
MKRFLLSLAIAAALLAGCTPGNPVLTVEGGRIQGVATATPGVTVYKGIPYAAPPVGGLRWKAPQPVVPWDGVRTCDTFGAPAWQNPHTPGGYTEEFFFDGDPEFSEDCLYLNVWTPAAGKPQAKLPVTLWVHGGGYMAGWGSEPEMDGEEWARHGGILVTFNYRLGLLGFLAHPALSAENPEGLSGNYGMLDQIAALKWVRANIAAFGGDPDRITLMGQSAGAMSVQTLVTSPCSKDLVARAIIQSGGGISERSLLGRATLADAEASGKAVMDWAGLGTLEAMRAADPKEFLTLAWRYAAETHQAAVGIMAPVIDGNILPEPFGEAALNGRIADVPYMIGGTLDDMAGLAGGIDRFCAAREAAGNVAYAYQFARRLPTDGRPNVLEGAFHSSELWYMFKSLRFCWRPFTKGDEALAEQMVTYWTRFADTGNPDGKGAQTWTPCTAESPLYMVFRLDENDAVASAMGAPLQP